MENKTICILNNKGGVGKTTISSNLAYILSKKNTVLLIDLDQQANLTKVMNAKKRDIGIDDVLLNNKNIRSSIHKVNENIFIVTGLCDFENLATSLNVRNRYDSFTLKHSLKECYDMFDYIIIDNAPNINVITRNAICASHFVLIPIVPEAFSIMGLAQLYKTFEQLKTKNNFVSKNGLVLNMVDGRRKTHSMFEEQLKNNKYFPLLQAKIRINSWIANAQALGWNDEMESNPKALHDFLTLTKTLQEQIL